MDFPVSGVETYWWLPPLVAFAISCLTATGGVSGGFLLLPFQVSVLGFTGPAVSPTSLVFNVLAIPTGVYRYCREQRMVWPLAGGIIIGTLPGMFLGAIIRVTLLPDPRFFKPFVGVVLGYIGFRLIKDVFFGHNEPAPGKTAPAGFQVLSPVLNLRQVSYEFNGHRYRANLWSILLLSFAVGIIGGAYGIGGGAIIAPFLVTVFGLPVYTVAGAALFGTFVNSIAGVLIYLLVAQLFSSSGLVIAPDWLLGALFGIGGMFGIYVGARLQRFVPSRAIKGFLAACVVFIAVVYISVIFR
ncbi:MAG: sulfite exporter TauE/SafE family protein [Candidatus Zixiibacteriota bacterium]